MVLEGLNFLGKADIMILGRVPQNEYFKDSHLSPIFDILCQ